MTAEQMELAPPSGLDRSKLSPDELYGLFVAEHPAFLAAVASTARQLEAKGRRLSINLVFEEMRQRVHTEGDIYALNNTMRAPTTRALVKAYPEFEGKFRTRATRR